MAAQAGCGGGRGKAVAPDDEALGVIAQRETPANSLDWFETHLAGSDGIQGENVQAMALSGNSLLVGALNSAHTGSARVLAGSETGWVAEGYPLVTIFTRNLDFRWSVALAGDTAVVGMPAFDVVGMPGFNPTIPDNSQVYVATRSGASWAEQQVLVPDSEGLIRGFGISVGISENTAIVGDAASFTAEGFGYIFERSATTWGIPQRIAAPDGASMFGASVAISGDTALIGAPFSSNFPDGGAYVFRRSDVGWVFQQKLALTDPTGGPTCVPVGGIAHGVAVALSGSTAVIGAPLVGAAYVFEQSDAGWVQTEKLVPGDPDVPDRCFGVSVAITGDLIVVGSPESDGAAYVFARSGEHWPQQHKFLAGPRTGSAVSALPDTVALAGPGGGYVERLRPANGIVCASDAECGSRHCVSGICCDQPCGPCGSCATGTCLAFPARSAGDPSCEPYGCSGTAFSCQTSCASDDQCSLDAYCDQSACFPARPAGSACGTAHECLSGRCINGVCAVTAANGSLCAADLECAEGHCTDGYCCDSACTGQCEACDVAPHPGMCTAVVGSPRGVRSPCTGQGSSCGGSCDGRERTACDYPDQKTACARTCKDGVQTDVACDGRGGCTVSTVQSCDNLVCGDDGACKPRCSSNLDCALDYACIMGECRLGATCRDDHTSEGSSGVQDCTPYRCSATGSCGASCASVADCAQPNVCDPSHRCVPPPSIAAFGSSCAMVPFSGRGPNGCWVVFGLVMLLLKRRRK